jgi:hypothetical protein
MGQNAAALNGNIALAGAFNADVGGDPNQDAVFLEP